MAVVYIVPVDLFSHPPNLENLHGQAKVGFIFHPNCFQIVVFSPIKEYTLKMKTNWLYWQLQYVSQAISYAVN